MHSATHSFNSPRHHRQRPPADPVPLPPLSFADISPRPPHDPRLRVPALPAADLTPQRVPTPTPALLPATTAERTTNPGRRRRARVRAARTLKSFAIVHPLPPAVSPPYVHDTPNCDRRHPGIPVYTPGRHFAALCAAFADDSTPQTVDCQIPSPFSMYPASGLPGLHSANSVFDRNTGATMNDMQLRDGSQPNRPPRTRCTTPCARGHRQNALHLTRGPSCWPLSHLDSYRC